MYLVRRVWVAKPREARRAATVAAKIGKAYEDADQRDSVRVYFNSGTTPGDKDRVIMEWIADTLESPYRAGNEYPATSTQLGPQLRDLTTESWIEFYELLTEDKHLD